MEDHIAPGLEGMGKLLASPGTHCQGRILCARTLPRARLGLPAYHQGCLAKSAPPHRRCRFVVQTTQAKHLQPDSQHLRAATFAEQRCAVFLGFPWRLGLANETRGSARRQTLKKLFLLRAEMTTAHAHDEVLHSNALVQA